MALQAAVAKHQAAMKRKPPLFDQRFLELIHNDRVSEQ
jgi:hypothetical protein